jgi:nitroreductase
MPEYREWAQTLHQIVRQRQTVLPKRLAGPQPSPEELAEWLEAATHAPDHGRLRPFRFIFFPPVQRDKLGLAFAQALRERDPSASEAQLRQAHEKALRAPVLLVAVIDAGPAEAEVGVHERLIAAGCAIQNLLLSATARGWGSALTSGKAMSSSALRELLALGPSEQAICCINVGIAQEHRAVGERPSVRDITQTMTDAGLADGLEPPNTA